MTANDIRIVSSTADIAGLGETLRRARESQRLTLDQIGSALKIKPAYLAALEGEQYAALPTVTHAKGFLRSYAQYLGLADRIDALLAQYQRAISKTGDGSTLAMPTPLPEGKLPTVRVMVGALVGAALLCVIWYAMQPSRPQLDPIAPPPADLESAPPPKIVAPETPVSAPVQETPVTEAPPAPVPTIAATVAPAAPPVPAAPQVAPQAETAPVAPAASTADGSLRIRAVADSWIEIQDRTGATIFSRLLKAGQEYQVVPEPGLRLTTGNGAGVRLVKDGKEGPPLGSHAEVVRNISLSGNATAAPPVRSTPKPRPAPAAKPEIMWNAPRAVSPVDAPYQETD